MSRIKVEYGNLTVQDLELGEVGTRFRQYFEWRAITFVTMSRHSSRGTASSIVGGGKPSNDLAQAIAASAIDSKLYPPYKQVLSHGLQIKVTSSASISLPLARLASKYVICA